MQVSHVLLPLFLTAMAAQAADPALFEYKLLATTRVSTMEKEMAEAAEQGFEYRAVMGGETSFGGSEAVVVMQRRIGAAPAERQAKLYKLLATNKTSTMQKEMQELGEEGFEYRGQTVFATTFGGHQVVVIMELDVENPTKRVDYRLLATKKTSTMEKELREAGAEGFEVMDLTVGKTAFAGSELVAIMRREAR